MTRAFIHVLWAHPSLPRSIAKILPDVRRAAAHPLRPGPEVAYVFGAENYAFVRSLGYEAVLADPRPVVYPGNQVWRHKLEAWRLAARDFDEFVYSDWDFPLSRPLPGNFWDLMGRRAPLQSPLLVYKVPRVTWREWRGLAQKRQVPAGGFVYFRGAAGIVDELIRVWEEPPCRPPPPPVLWDDELAMAWWVDHRLGGWKGAAAYHAAGHEPFCVRIGNWYAGLPAPLRQAKVPYWVYGPGGKECAPEAEVMVAFFGEGRAA